MKFICDDHLGKLCRLLRLLGHDTDWCRTGRDALIVEASAGGRLFLTRDASWSGKTLPGPKLVLTATDPFAQLREVLASCALQVRREDLLQRCLLCNMSTAAAAKERVADRLPPYVRRTKDLFRICPGCERIYWEGTHVDAMLRRLRAERIL